MPKSFKLKVFNRVIALRLSDEGKSGSITSDLKEASICEDGDLALCSAIDGIESVVLGHAIAGVEVTAPAYLAGLETALEAIANNL